MNINGKLLVLKLSMKYNGPREWVSLSTVHAVLREEAHFLYRKETEESPLNADLNSSMETVDLFARSIDFSNFGRYYFHIRLRYLATITGELDLSGSTTDKKGLIILSKWCTDLYGLILKRCCNLDNEALCCLVDFSSLLCIDLSENGFINRETLRILLQSKMSCIHLVVWNLSLQDEVAVMDEFLGYFPFVTIHARNGDRILEITDDY